MNIVNLVFMIIITIAVLEGIYRGFLHSSLNLGTFFLSIITSYLLYPVVSAAVKGSTSLFNFLLYYTEGTEKVANFEDTSLLVSSLSPDKLHSIVSSSSLTEPFSTLVTQNMQTAAYASSGLTTVGEYFNITIVSAVLNILSFLAVFLIARLLFTFVLGAVNYTVKFPELKRYDRTTGAIFGATRGFLACFLIVMIIPIIFLVMPVDQVTNYIQSSSLGMFFYHNNFFLHLIRGII